MNQRTCGLSAPVTVCGHFNHSHAVELLALPCGCQAHRTLLQFRRLLLNVGMALLIMMDIPKDEVEVQETTGLMPTHSQSYLASFALAVIVARVHHNSSSNADFAAGSR